VYPIGFTRALPCASPAAEGRITLAALVERIAAQASVPVSETEVKDALRKMGDVVSIDWRTRTIRLQDGGPAGQPADMDG
jgi:hypothetical protein